MIVSLLYKVTRRLLSVPSVVLRSEAAKDAELLVLRHTVDSPWPTVYKRFAAWEKVGATQRLLDGPRDRARLAEGRVAAPSAAVVDTTDCCWRCW